MKYKMICPDCKTQRPWTNSGDNFGKNQKGVGVCENCGCHYRKVLTSSFIFLVIIFALPMILSAIVLPTEFTIITLILLMTFLPFIIAFFQPYIMSLEKVACKNDEILECSTETSSHAVNALYLCIFPLTGMISTIYYLHLYSKDQNNAKRGLHLFPIALLINIVITVSLYFIFVHPVIAPNYGPWTEYDKNGNFQGSYIRINGKKLEHGKVIDYLGGAKWKEAHYKKGVLHGKYKEWNHTNGNLTSEGEYVNGKQHGKWTYWDDNGNISEKREFIEGKKDGEWVVYIGGEKAENGKYKNGMKNGYWTKYFDGRKWKEGTYLNDVENGRWIYWNENGKKSQQGLFVDGKKIGTWINWDDHGIIDYEITYTKDDQKYKITDYYEGQRSEEGPYVNGKRHGKWIRYLEGYKVAEGPYVDGKKNGKWTRFYKNQKCEEGEYVDDLKQGKWIRYYEGEITEVTIYKDGIRIEN